MKAQKNRIAEDYIRTGVILFIDTPLSEEAIKKAFDSARAVLDTMFKEYQEEVFDIRKKPA